MWPTVVILLCLGGLFLHFKWRGLYAAALSQKERLEKECKDLKERQTELRSEEKSRWETLFNSIVEGVLLLDGAGKVALANKAFERLFGITAGVRGHTLMEALGMHRIKELVDKCAAQGRVSDFEFDMPDLSNRSFLINAASFKDRVGQPQGVILVFHDITRIKRLENTRKDFVANVSHELRTPLALIKGYVETLIDGAKDDPKVALRFMRTIEKHADRLTYLIEDLLTVSQLESGQVVMNQTCVEVGSLIGKVGEDLQSRAEEENIRIQIHGTEGLVVRADEDRIQQVLFNLMENGIKYGKKGGVLRISAMPGEDGMVEIRVADDGPGIPEEARERIFERFYRLDLARSREQGGTGLGLSIVKHIVQSHGGKVWVASPPGQGACFHFTLPAGETASAI